MQEQEHKTSHLKRDLILVAVILIIAAAGFLFTQYNRGKLFHQKEESAEAAEIKVVEVTVDGRMVEKLDLNTDTEVTIHGYQDGTNHLIIRDGEVWIDDASCPDKICIHQGKISSNSDMIVCLPNLMIAQIRIEEREVQK